MGQILTNIKSVIVAADEFLQNDLNEESFIIELLKETDEVVEKAYNDIILNNSDSNYHDILLYSMKNKQYFERAYYVRFSYELFRPNWQIIGKALASVELRYASLVVTDDIFDRNNVRMGKESLPKKAGDYITISVGAILKSLSSVALTQQLSELNSNENIINYLISLDESSHIKVYEGQIMDINSENLKIEEITEDYYLKMIRKTTAEDVGFCFVLGGLLAGCSLEQAEILRSCGISLGVMMQIRDDLIDYINSTDTINKIPFRDFELNKKRLPLILAYKFSTSDEKIIINELLKKDLLSDNERKQISDLIFKKEAILYSNNIMERLKESLLENFFKLNPNSKSKSIISELVNNIVVL